MNASAPICLFLFDRPDHLRKTIETLKACDGFDGSQVYAFGDGAKRPDQADRVQAARAVAEELLGDRAIYRFSPANKGLARSIIDGVTEVVGLHGRAIVVEDDLDLGPEFLSFLNAALDRYADDENVYQISGHAFDAPELTSDASAAFLPFIGTWGWGTWKRAWSQFDEQAEGWEALRSDRALRRRFNLGGVYDYATMMERQMAGWRDSWGIRWYWTVFKNAGLVLYPPRTLVRNEGMDGSGSHGRGFFRRYDAGPTELQTGPIRLPPPRLDEHAFVAVQRTIWRQNGGVLGKLIDTAKRLVARVPLGR